MDTVWGNYDENGRPSNPGAEYDAVESAEDIVTRAMSYDPNMVRNEARRRAFIRKYRSTPEDFQRAVQTEVTELEARAPLGVIRGI